MKEYQLIYTTFSPKYSSVSLCINILTEEIFAYSWDKYQEKKIDLNRGEKMNDYEDICRYIKLNDRSNKWFQHYHNFFGVEDGTYIENMFMTLRRRHNKPLINFIPKMSYYK